MYHIVFLIKSSNDSYKNSMSWARSLMIMQIAFHNTDFISLENAYENEITRSYQSSAFILLKKHTVF